MKNRIQPYHQQLTTRRIISNFYLAAVPLFLLLLLVPACMAQTRYPGTPAGNQTSALLDAFNAGDGPKYKEFLSKNFPTRLQNADQDMDFREMTGGFDLRQIGRAHV